MTVPNKDSDTQAEVAHVELTSALAATSKASDGCDQVLEHDIAAFEDRKMDFRTAMAIVVCVSARQLREAVPTC